MAILVRSATRQVPLLRRALTASGVPVSVAGDELPLPEEPGTRPLLTLLRCALSPGTLDEQTAAELLTGPLGGTDALGLRRLRRWLRTVSDAAGSQASSADADPLAAAILNPGELTMVPRQVAAPAAQLGRLLAVAREAIAAGQSARRPCGPSGTRPGWPRCGRPPAPRAARPARRPTGTWTRCWRCSTRLPGSPTRCHPARQACSWTAWPARRSPVTRWPSRPPGTRPSAS